MAARDSAATSVYARVAEMPLAVRGFFSGVVGTLVMTVALLAGLAIGGSPFPELVPIAIIDGLLGANAAGWAVMLVAVLAHLAYGGLWAAVFSVAVHPITEGKGVLLGILLWIIEQVIFFPLLGWGVFGTDITVPLGFAAPGTSLFFHLFYGLIVGMLLDQVHSYVRGQRS